MLFSKDYLKENMMGPNAVMLLEELTDGLDLTAGMRIMDLGCGKGLTSMALADKTGAQVFAVDLWISPTENHERFSKMGFGKQIIPIHADASIGLPFPHDYFDAVVSVDSYHYFGRDAAYMDAKLVPHVKKGGIIALAFPGFKQEIHSNLPEMMLRTWTPQDLETMQTCAWWEDLLKQSQMIENIQIREMDNCAKSWADWLECDNNPYAVSDREPMDAGAGAYMNMISVTCRRKK